MTRRSVWFDCVEPTPVGPVWLAVSENGMVSLDIDTKGERFFRYLQDRYAADVFKDDSKTRAAVHQISEYLDGQRQTFELAIDWSKMTDFQARVLQETSAVPYGETTTYAELARRVGKPRGARAVGRAEATNPIPLVLPCHRVVGQDGSLRGYGSGEGLKTKAWLISFERANRKTIP